MATRGDARAYASDVMAEASRNNCRTGFMHKPYSEIVRASSRHWTPTHRCTELQSLQLRPTVSSTKTVCQVSTPAQVQSVNCLSARSRSSRSMHSKTSSLPIAYSAVAFPQSRITARIAAVHFSASAGCFRRPASDRISERAATSRPANWIISGNGRCVPTSSLFGSFCAFAGPSLFAASSLPFVKGLSAVFRDQLRQKNLLPNIVRNYRYRAAIHYMN